MTTWREILDRYSRWRSQDVFEPAGFPEPRVVLADLEELKRTLKKKAGSIKYDFDDGYESGYESGWEAAGQAFLTRAKDYKNEDALEIIRDIYRSEEIK